MKKSLLTLVAVAALTAATGVALAQDVFPSKPIRLVVGYAAGGPTDIIARVLAKDMSIALGQSVYVENKPGASSMIATREVKNASPDGYTLLLSSLGLNVNPILLGEQAGYNAKTDFVPISNVAVNNMIVVNAYDSPVKTMQDLLAKARTKPEAVSFASSGNGGSGHLAGELLATQAKTKMLHVPYKGNGPGLLEVMSGRVDFMLYPVIGIAENVAAKRIKILAVGTEKRLPQFPNAPTMSEVGFPGFEATAPWVGLLAPAKTPVIIVNRLNDAVVKSLAKTEVKAQLEKLGAVIVGDSPSEFAAYLKSDYERWDKVIKTAAIKAEVN